MLFRAIVGPAGRAGVEALRTGAFRVDVTLRVTRLQHAERADYFFLPPG
jgi:hypothetical protein